MHATRTAGTQACESTQLAWLSDAASVVEVSAGRWCRQFPGHSKAGELLFRFQARAQERNLLTNYFWTWTESGLSNPMFLLPSLQLPALTS